MTKNNSQPQKAPKGRIRFRGPIGGWAVSAFLTAAIVAVSSGCDSSSSPAEQSGKSGTPQTVVKAESVQATGQPAAPTSEVKAATEPQTKPAAEAKPPSTQPADGKAIITPDKKSHDFGSLMIGPKLNHAFKITNTGKAPLEITKVKPACGCTVAGRYPKMLAPGESGDFPFALQSQKLRGKFNKKITISSNDPVTPQLQLALTGELKHYIDVTPTGAYFGRVYSEKSQERILKIKNNADQDLKLELKPVAEDAKFDFELTEKTPGKEFELKITSKPPYEAGSYARANATLTSNIDAQKKITVNAVLAAAKRIDVLPETLTIPAPSPSAAKNKTGRSLLLRFTNYGEKPVKLLEATADEPEIKLVVDEKKAGSTYTVQIQLPAGYQPPAAGKTITLKTDDEEIPTIQVPLKASRVARKPSQPAKPRERPAMKLVGKPAPEFKLATLDGKSASSTDFSNNKATVLNFVAPNCGWCKRQIPQVEKVRSEFESKGVRFLNVTQTMGKKFTNDQVTDAMKKLGSQLEIAPNPDNKVGKLYRATSFPTMFVVGKDGTVKHVNIGGAPTTGDDLKNQLVSILEGKPST